MFQTASRMIAPMMKVALMRSSRPSLRKPRFTSSMFQVLILASGAKKTESRYPAASPEPMASTGLQATQLHQSDIGAVYLL